MRCTGPCRESVGAKRKMAAPAMSISATAATAAFSYLFIQHETRGERGKHDEQYVEVDEEPDRLLVGAWQPKGRLHRLPARDDERDPQRQDEHRQQQLSCAHPGDD